MDAAEFVNQQTMHRLGGLGDLRASLSEAARLQALSASSGGTLAWDAAAQMPYAVNGWACPPGLPQQMRNNARGVKVPKARDTLLSLQTAGADFDLLIDMQDRRVRALNTSDGTVFPTICFNRVTGAQGRILWPMPGTLHDIGADAFLGPFPDPDGMPFARRAERLVWRGGMTGRAGSDVDVRLEGYRFDKIFAEVERGKRDMAWAADRLAEFPRYRFVSRLKRHDWADVGFVEQPHLHPLSASLMQPLQRPALMQRDQARSKYIAVLRGADLGSSFFWTMNSGSLGLVMESPWESFASVHFRPWQHYVPFRADLSDLQERMLWCISHPAECEAMVRAAGDVCALLARPDLRAEVDRAVVGGLRQVLGVK